jgi:hypothetical protein
MRKAAFRCVATNPPLAKMLIMGGWSRDLEALHMDECNERFKRMQRRLE